MRIHEVLEACVEYVAMDGVLGTDPLALQRHIESLDASVDAASFSHIYRLLSRHPTVLIAISTVPLTLSDGSVQLGTAPLPADYVPPDPSRRANIDFMDLYDSGARGSQIVVALRGPDGYESYMQGARARRQQEEEGMGKDRVREARSKARDGVQVYDQVKGENGEVLFTILEEDDAPLKAGETVMKEDLAGLLQKWGSRLRIRATDDEVYFRLTGSHIRLGKVSKLVLQTLQLCARSRERGISAIELGPLMGTTQGTMHYMMKVLIEMGLCVKLPMIQHGATTHLLIFHKYLEMNASYRSLKQLPPLPVATRPAPKAAPAADDAEDDQIGTGQNLDIDRSPLTRQDLTDGTVLKERLVRILDHPGLTNHLLRDRNLLELLGWYAPFVTRYRRTLVRHINALAAAGIVERLVVGHRRVDCLRLTKYNPDFKGPPPARVVDEQAETIVSYDMAEEAFSKPLNPMGGVDSSRSLERNVTQVIKAAGKSGITYAQIREQTGNPYTRFTEFLTDRISKLWVPNHLASFGIREVIENAGRERRLRMYDDRAYREYLQQIGEADNSPTVPPEEIGRFADVSYRKFATSPAELKTMLEDVANGKTIRQITGFSRAKAGMPPPKQKNQPRRISVLTTAGANAPPKSAVPVEKLWLDDGSEHQRGSRYVEGSIQVRGRPRKYLYVVTPEGSINRSVIGQVKSRDDLAPVWIYLKNKGVLVPAPIEFTGLGDVPPVTKEMMAGAKEPDWFLQFENAKNAKQSKGVRKKAAARKDAKKPGTGDVVEIAAPEAGKGKKGKGKAKEARGESEDEIRAIEPEADETGEGSRKRKPAATDSPALSRKTRKVADSPGIQNSAAPSTAVTMAHDTSVRRSGRARMSQPVYTVAGNGDEEDVAMPAHGNASSAAPPEGALEPVGDEDVFGSSRDGSATGPSTTKRARSPAVPDAESQKRVKVSGTAASELPTDDASIDDPSDNSQIRRAGPSDRSTSTLPTPKIGLEAVRSNDTPQAVATPQPKSSFAVRWRKTLHAAPAPKQRIDLGLVRRMNEIIETLKLEDVGGVMLDSKLIREHQAWTERHAGTDTPHAPPVGYGMDRNVFKHAVDRLENDGRIKRTKAISQTAVGRWTQQDVLFLPEKPIEVVNAYCARLQQDDPYSVYPARKAGGKVEIEAQAFTRIDLANPIHGNVRGARVRPLEANFNRPGTARRTALLQEAYVGAMLLGWQPGQHARARTLHIEMCRLAARPDLPNVVSNAPDIVLLSLLLDDLSVGTFFQCVWTQTYDEELDQWLRTGDNATTPLKDIPERFRALAGFANQQTKSKLKTLLVTLVDLQIVTPLIPCPEDQAVLNIETRDARSGRFFRAAPAVGVATHLLLHPVGPIYHIAHPSRRLLGTTPAKTKDEVAVYWARVQEACNEVDGSRIGPVQPATAVFPDVGPIKPTLDLPEERLRFLSAWARWQGEIRLLNQQSRAFDGAINAEGTLLIKTDKEIDQFAYENALPFAYVKAQLFRRSEVIQQRLARAEKQRRDEEKAAAKRRIVAHETLRQKMIDRREQIKRDWEARIERVAKEAEVEFNEQLVNFVNRRAIAMNKATILDKTIHEIIRLSRTQMDADEETNEAAEVFMPLGKRKQKKPETFLERTARENPQGFAKPAIPGKRRRFHWTAHIDELLLDAEAILRARSVGKGNRGRRALGQLEEFEPIAYNNIRVRLKRLLDDPGRNAYFQHLIGAWREMWMQHRGSAELPDANWESAEDFDLKAHLAYLRKHLVKGDLTAAITDGPKQIVSRKVPDLPESIEELFEYHDWKYDASKTFSLSTMWDGSAEEQRLTSLLGAPLNGSETGIKSDLDREKGMMRGLLKTIVSTPNEVYNQGAVVNLLKSYPADAEKPELAAMVNNRTLLLHHTAAATGRFYGYPATWKAQTEGPLSAELFTQATKLRDAVREKREHVLPVVAEGGEFAELFQMVSDGTVELDVDIQKMSIVRKGKATYNTRKMTDAAFEMPIKITCTRDLVASNKTVPSPQAIPPMTAPWPSQGLGADDDMIEQIVQEVEKAGPDGLGKAELYEDEEVDPADVDAALAKLSSKQPAVIFWAGFDTPRLVSVRYALKWMQPIIMPNEERNSSAQRRYCAPRRWVDQFGTLLVEDLERCIGGAVAQVITRPGMRESALRRRLSPTMDRQETSDVLDLLVIRGLAFRAWAKGGDRILPPAAATGPAEEDEVVWSPVSPWCA